MAARLHWIDGEAVVDMPRAAQEILRFSEEDKIFYQVLRQDETRISGDALIPGPLLRPFSRAPTFRDAILDGIEIRIARIHCVNPKVPEHVVFVQVAETLGGRKNLTRLLLASIVVPQALLIALSSLVVWFGIGKGLTPLGKIQESVKHRNPQDLSPLVFSTVPVEVRPLVESINDLLDRLRHEIDRQKRFVGNAAHQLRTPLAGLRTYVEFTQRLSQDPQILRSLGQIDYGIDRMSHLVERLLSLARAEPQRELMDKSLVDLNFIVSDVVNSIVPLALNKEIDFRFESADDAALLMGNKDLLCDLAANLIENAILYTPNGGQVVVRVASEENITLSVIDDGPGIPECERERVFERFYRILGSGPSGSGLGLAIVHEIALAHRAKISLDDPSNGKGTTVVVSFANGCNSSL